MNTYVALLRGIMPSNPNMRNEKLRGVFESLGYTNVQTLISSGNVLFDSESTDTAKLEETIEKELFKKLGIKSPAYIRSKSQINSLLKKDPFKGKDHGPRSYLIVSFLKQKPYEIFTEVDMTNTKTTQFMSQLDKKYNKEVTTRTWKTVERIAKKMGL